MSQITPGVVTMPGLDPIGAGLVEGEVSRLQNDTNSRRQAGVAMAGIASEGQAQQAHLKEQQRQFDIRQQWDRERTLIEDRLARKQLEVHSRIEMAKQRMEAARAANDADEVRTASEEFDGYMPQLHQVQEDWTKLTTLHALQSGLIKEKVAGGLETYTAGRMQDRNNMAHAVHDAMVDYRFSPEINQGEGNPNLVGAERPAPAAPELSPEGALKEAGKGQIATSDVWMGLGAKIAGKEDQRPQRSWEDATKGQGGDGEMGPRMPLEVAQARQSGKAVGATEKIVSKVAPLMFPSDKMEGGMGTLSVLLDTLQEAAVHSAKGDKTMEEGAVQSAKMAAQDLRDKYRVSDWKLNVLFSAIDAMAEGTKQDVSRENLDQGKMQDQAKKEGSQPGGRVGTDPGRISSKLDILSRMGAIGATRLGLSTTVRVRRTSDKGDATFEGTHDPLYKKVGDGKYEMADGDPDMQRILLDVVNDVAQDGNLDHPEILNNLPSDMAKMLMAKIQEYKAEVTGKEKEFGYAGGPDYSAAEKVLTEKFGHLWVQARGAATRGTAKASARNRPEMEKFLGTEQGGFNDLSTAMPGGR